MLYKARNEAIKFYGDYSLIISEAKTKSKQNDKTKEQYLKYQHPSKCFNDYQ